MTQLSNDTARRLINRIGPLSTCNCRWAGDTLVQQCELHAAHVEAIREWARRAKEAERKARAAAELAS